MTDYKTYSQWYDKAVAFLARSRQELWGKHNDDLMAWFFQNGFKNAFVKDHLFGWNRRGKFRSPEHWGLGADYVNGTTGENKLWFPEGIVIPLAVDKRLRKLVIYRHTLPEGNRTYSVPGSSTDPFILGASTNVVAVVQNIMDGYYLFQETNESVCIIVPDPSTDGPDDRAAHVLTNAETVFAFPDQPHGTPGQNLSHWLNDYPDARIVDCDRTEMAKTVDTSVNDG